MNKLPIYARLLHTVNSIRQETPGPLLDGCEEIMAYIAVKSHAGDPAKISDLVQSLQFGTAPTLQRKLSCLVEHGYVRVEKCAKDSRAKKLYMTESGEGLLNDRSRLLKNLLGSLA